MASIDEPVETHAAPLPTELLEKGEYRCLSCGYGIMVVSIPTHCPMCSAAEWESVAWQPFTRAREQSSLV